MRSATKRGPTHPTQPTRLNLPYSPQHPPIPTHLTVIKRSSSLFRPSGGGILLRNMLRTADKFKFFAYLAFEIDRVKNLFPAQFRTGNTRKW